MAENRSNLTSYKGKKKHSYGIKFKKQLVYHTEEKNNRSAASHYCGGEPKRVREWKKNLEKIKVTNEKTQSLELRKYNDEELEDKLVH